MRHIIIKVSDTHHGGLDPSVLIAMPAYHVAFHGLTGVSFPNPRGGWSIGTKVGEVDIEREA